MKKYLNAINSFKDKRILIIGDFCVDKFWDVKKMAFSPEYPAPRYTVPLGKNSVKMNPGAAGNVANGISALEAKTYVAGVIGNDEYSKELIGMFREKGIETSGMVIQPGRITSCYARLISGENLPYPPQVTTRIDFESEECIGGESRKKLLDYVAKNSENLDAIIVADYDEFGTGLINREFLEGIRGITNRHNLFLIGNSRSNAPDFRGFDCIVENILEAEKAYGKKITSVHSAGEKLISSLGLDALLITKDKNGMEILTGKGEHKNIPAVEKEIIDPCGAGDSVVCAFTLGLSSGLNYLEAAELSNYAAGAAVMQKGLAAVTRQELAEKIDSLKYARFS